MNLFGIEITSTQLLTGLMAFLFALDLGWRVLMRWIDAKTDKVKASASDMQADTNTQNAVSEMALQGSAYIRSLVEQIGKHQTSILELNRSLGKVEGELTKSNVDNLGLVARLDTVEGQLKESQDDFKESQRTVKELRETIKVMAEKIDLLEKALAKSELENPDV